jgi:hypothetical protein
MTTGTILGYHGTTSADAETILKNNFRLLDKPEYWLGKGAYFFADYPPAADGRQEALFWVKQYKKYPSWAIIKAEISTENQLNPIAKREHRLYLKKIRNILFQKHIRSGQPADSFSENRIFLHIDKTDSFWSYVALFNPSGQPKNLILDLQVQVCVKDLQAVKTIRIVQEGGAEYER